MSGFDGMNEDLASRIKQLISAARNAGYTIHPGSGFRTVEEQIQLRKTNGCPDVWSSPASSCRVPTAIPGRSNHNHGLAMDLSYGTPEAAQWANAHAAQFGLHFPVDGENWHVELMSTDGSYDGPVGQAMQDGAIGFDTQKMNEPANPQDELANRMHAVMRILGSSTQPISDPHALEDPYGVAGEDIAPMDQAGTDTTTIPGQGMAMPSGGGDDPSGFGAYARSQFGKYGWNENEFDALRRLWNSESGDRNAAGVTWNPNAQNPTSTAYGIAQFLNGTWEGTGFQKTSDPSQQIQAGLAYIKARYGSPAAAWAFKQRKGWY